MSDAGTDGPGTRDAAWFMRIGEGHFPALLGIEISEVGDRSVHASMAVHDRLLAPNGFLHAGAVVTLADTAAGYGCVAHLPAGAKNFTAIELKSNFLGTAHAGRITAHATAAHLGRTTQVWDLAVRGEDARTIALFRCTQLIVR